MTAAAPAEPEAGMALELLRAYIADYLPEGTDARETWLFGGNFFMVRGNMFIGLFEKPTVYIMVRVGKERMNEALLKIPGAVPCVCKSGRIFPGTINVPFEHFRGNERLAIIVDLALRHNAGLEAKGPKEKVRPKKPAVAQVKRKRDAPLDTPCDSR